MTNPTAPAKRATGLPIKPIEVLQVRRRRAFEAVCDQIRLKIRNGELSPGDQLPNDADLADMLNVNRNSVREALRSLEIAGVVRSVTGAQGGFFITDGKSDSMQQAMRDMVALGQIKIGSLTEARIMVLESAIRLAVARGTPADFEALEADIARLERLAKDEGLSHGTPELTAFYRLLAEATHNEVIVMLVEGISDIVRNLIAQTHPRVQPDFIGIRRSILRHIRAGDTDKAIGIMTRHLEKMHAHLEQEGKRATPATKRTRSSKRTA